MLIIELVFIERLTEPHLEIGGEIAAGRETSIDRSDVVGLQRLDPASIINRLCHSLTRSPVTLKFAQNQRPLASQGEQVDNAAIHCPLLPAAQHPSARQTTRRG